VGREARLKPRPMGLLEYAARADAFGCARIYS
jgi:hypothetical protein